MGPRMRRRGAGLQSRPSEYIKKHLWSPPSDGGTRNKPGHLATTLKLDRLGPHHVATDYPHWDYDEPRPQRISDPASDPNAQRFFREQSQKSAIASPKDKGSVDEGAAPPLPSRQPQRGPAKGPRGEKF